MLLSLGTDDCLISVPSYQYAEDFIAYMKKYFQLSIQQGPILKFLGIRIVQTNHAISLDQSAYIFDALTGYFGTDVDKVKSLSMPMRYDSAYERELFEAIPLNAKELTQFELDYNGTY